MNFPFPWEPKKDIFPFPLGKKKRSIFPIFPREGKCTPLRGVIFPFPYGHGGEKSCDSLRTTTSPPVRDKYDLR